MSSVIQKAALPVKCDKGQFKNIIQEIVFERDGISFSAIKNGFIMKIDGLNLFAKEPNTEYLTINLNYEDEREISKILWEMILNKELFLDFSDRNDFLFFRNSEKL